MTAEDWQTVRQLVAWLDRANGTGPHETAMRLMKLTEEAGRWWGRTSVCRARTRARA